jgi:hypothetical protein
MSDLPSELDLKFLPDWLKETAPDNRYADYEGEREDRSRRDDRGGKGDRAGGRGARPDRGNRREGKPLRRDDRGAGARAPRRDEPPRGDRRAEKAPQRRDTADTAGRASAPLAPRLKIEFLPEPNGLAMIAKQIKASGRAYPLFGTARLFLERPERHRVRFTSLDPAQPLFQVGDGPVLFDQAGVERNAFRQMRHDFYREELVQGDPLKGNFTNVARSRSTGRLLGPTNHHGYQPALRKLYEERFSRRMPFSQFQQEEIEILSDDQAIADWKEQARSLVTYTTLSEAEPIVFKSAADAEQHFRRQYLPHQVKTGPTLETSGEASRASGDREIVNALREIWEKERAFPANLVNSLRPALVESGLHFFKHRKRILYISPIRPQRHAAGQIFSEGITLILSVVEASPRITRPQLATKLLGDHHDAPETASKKAALAGDLHYLIHAGHVIEFHDGTLDLPLSPKAEGEAGSAKERLEQGGTPMSAEARESEVTPGVIIESVAPTKTVERAEIDAAQARGDETKSEARRDESG